MVELSPSPSEIDSVNAGRGWTPSVVIEYKDAKTGAFARTKYFFQGSEDRYPVGTNLVVRILDETDGESPRADLTSARDIFSNWLKGFLVGIAFMMPYFFIYLKRVI